MKRSNIALKEAFDDLAWRPPASVTLPELMRHEGTDPKEWKLEPHCQGCDASGRGHKKKDVFGFRLVALEVLSSEGRPLRQASIGFAAKHDKSCPFNYTDSPDFAYPPGRNTAKREEAENRKVIRDPRMAEGLDELLRVGMQYVTHRYDMPPKLKKKLDRSKTKHIYMRGLREHPHLIVIVQLVMADPQPREITEIVEGEEGSSFMTASSAATRSKKNRKPYGKVIWCPIGSQKLTYTSVNNEERVIDVPAAIGLHVARKNGGDVIYKRLLRPDTKEPYIIPVEREALRELVRPYYENKARLIGQEKALNRHGKPLRRKKPVDPGQTDMGFPKLKVA